MYYVSIIQVYVHIRADLGFTPPHGSKPNFLIQMASWDIAYKVVPPQRYKFV